MMTEKQQEKLQVCENNCVTRTAGVKRIDKRRMNKPREEVGERESHEEAGEEPAKVGWRCGKNGRRMVDEEREWLMKRADVFRVEGRRRERLSLRWDRGLCEERFSGSGRGMENEGKGWWEWRRLVETAVKQD